MSFNSAVAGDNWLNFTIGAATALGNGDYTLAALVKPAAGNNNCGFMQLRNGSSGVRSFLEDSLHIYGENEFGGFGTLTQGNWYLCIVKALSAATYSYSLWPYAADGSGTMSHGNSVFSASAGSACDNMRLGWGINRGNGDFAVIGLWNRKTSDAEDDSLKSNLLSTWAALAPVELISFENWDGTVGSEDVLLGSSGCSSVQGACGAATNPPSFDFALITVTDLVIADTSQAQAAESVALTQIHSLAVANADQSQLADNVPLSQVHVLGIQSASQAQQADSLGTLVPASGTVSGGVASAGVLVGSVTARTVALTGIIE